MGFQMSGEARRGGKRSRDFLPDRATLNAQSARHGARPGPRTCAVVYRRPPCVPRSREREKRPAVHANVQKSSFWFIPGLIYVQYMYTRIIYILYICTKYTEEVYECTTTSPTFNIRSIGTVYEYEVQVVMLHPM